MVDVDCWNAIAQAFSVIDHTKRPHERGGDASGEFHNGPTFGDFYELRDLIAKWQREEFARSFTEALVEYGLGRPFGFTDETLATEILTAAKGQDYQLASFIHSIVQTKEFQSK